MALIQKSFIALAALSVFLVSSTIISSSPTLSSGSSSPAVVAPQGVPSIVEVQAVQTQACSSQSTISSNFNENAISSGNYIWFNSVMKLSSPVFEGDNGQGGITIYFTGQTVTSDYFTLTLPDSEVIFSSSADSATTTFDTTGNMWVTTVPTTFTGNVFLSGFAYQVPAGGLPGGIHPVTWSGTFSSSNSFSGQWQWGAAVYTRFPSSWPSGYNSLGVKPSQGSQKGGQEDHPDPAGTPENYKSYVTGGATGGGGSNWTGSLSETSPFSCQFEAVPEMPGATLFLSIGVIAAFVSFRYRKFLNQCTRIICGHDPIMGIMCVVETRS